MLFTLGAFVFVFFSRLLSSLKHTDIHSKRVIMQMCMKLWSMGLLVKLAFIETKVYFQVPKTLHRS